MVKGLDTFCKYFAAYADQYVLIGGAACDIAFESNDTSFRATRDLDMVLIIEVLTPEFGERFWEFIKGGQYRNKVTNKGKPQFYRFDKPEIDGYPRMIELFCREDFKLKENKGIAPIHIDDSISSLSAILLDNDYYELLLDGRTIIDEMSVLRPEYLILFKAKAYLDLFNRRNNGEKVDSSNISKHKNDVLRIVAALTLNRIEIMSSAVKVDINGFISTLFSYPFDYNLLKERNLKNEEVIDKLKSIYD